MYHPTTRVLTVLELLQAHERISGPELARRLEVDVRTIRHYITLLQDLGIPIEAERGRYGAYRMRPGFKLPPLMFTEDEAVALTLGLLATHRLGLMVAAPATAGALAKVERVLPAAVRERVQALQDALVIEMPHSYTPPESAVVVAFSTAAQQRRRVQFGYRSWRDDPSERAIDPYGVVYFAGRWYAVGYCHLRADLRVFRLDRVQSATVLDQCFVRPESFDSLAFVQRSLANTPGEWAIEVLLETDLATAQDRVPAHLALLEPAPDGVILRCNVQRLEWFAHFLAGLDCPVVVRRPPELRDALRDLARALAAMAEAGEPDRATSASADPSDDPRIHANRR
jgi:predicted DNA-binding transcriptional regulator YafY